MRSLILSALLLATSLAALPAAGWADTPPKATAEPRKFVGLCVRTARDGYVVLEARVMQPSGDPKFDAQATKDVIGSSTPIPNQRMWFEWLATGVLTTPQDDDQDVPMTFDCSALDREARAKAKVR